MEINLKVTKKHKLNELESYTIQDICLVLNCGTRTANHIKDEILGRLIQKGIDIKKKSTYKVKRKDLLEYINSRDSNIHLEEDTEKKKEEILSRSLINVNDVRILLNCSVHVATKIVNDVRKNMISKGMDPILNHVLTSYVLEYIKNID